MPTDNKDIEKLERVGRSGENEREAAGERANKLNRQIEKYERKIGKKVDPVTLQEVPVVPKPNRNMNGQIILRKDGLDKSKNLNDESQRFAVKLNTPQYNTDEFEHVLNNVVTELLPKRPEIKKELTIPERIDKFFIEYEFLRDHIWDLKQEASTKSHVYLEKESDSYLPKRDKPSAYTGEQVGNAGRVKLFSGNKSSSEDFFK